jgi:adenylate cyclase
MQQTRQPTVGKRHFAAVMFTDMVGFMALSQEDESAALQLLEYHQEFLRHIFPQYSGREVKTTGDGFLVEFNTASAAVACGIDIQKRVARHNSECEATKRFQLRIGIHAGNVMARGGDLYGREVNLAARLEPLAEPGGICFSQPVHDAVRKQVAEPIVPLSGVAVKHLPYRVDLYRINVAPPQAPAAPIEKSVAVLPFVSCSPNHEDTHLGEGITDELVTALSQVKGLRVPAFAAPTAAEPKRRDIRKIGRQLGVNTIVEGTIRRSGEKLRVTARLLNVSDGTYLWCKSFHRKFTDVFAIQDQISRSIVQALRVRLGRLSERTFVKPSTSSSEAYELYLRGRHYWNLRGEHLKKSLHYFELAALEDPGYALACAAVADAYLLLGYYGYLPSTESFPRAKAAALKALAIDSNSAEARCALAFTAFMYDGAVDTAEREFKQALALNPNYITALYWFSSCLVALGRTDEALAADDRALQLSPVSLLANAHLAWTLTMARKCDAAIRQIKKTLALERDFVIAHRLLGQCWAQQGEWRRAVKAFEHCAELTKRSPSLLAWLAYAYGMSGDKTGCRAVLAEMSEAASREYVRAFLFAIGSVGLGEPEETLGWLEKAWNERDFWLQWLPVDPAFDSLRAEPGFVELLHRIRAKRPRSLTDVAPALAHGQVHDGVHLTQVTSLVRV